MVVSAAVAVAVIGAVASVLAAAVAFWAQLRATKLSAALNEQTAESAARREYEYEARKRLYVAYEPLRVRLLAATDSALRQILEMIRRPEVGATTESSPEYRLTATIYFLLAPLVVARMVERRLTLVDLALDEHIHTEFVLAQAICRSLADDAPIAQFEPALPYTPYVPGWREKREQCPQRFRRQGLTLGRLNTVLDVLHITRAEGEETLMTFGEFEPLLPKPDEIDVRTGPGAARDLFLEFDPTTRPVLWRVMVTQALLYWCFQETVFGQHLPPHGELKRCFTGSEMCAALRAALDARQDAARVEAFDITVAVACAYFGDRVVPALRRVRLLAQSSSASPS